MCENKGGKHKKSAYLIKKLEKFSAFGCVKTRGELKGARIWVDVLIYQGKPLISCFVHRLFLKWTYLRAQEESEKIVDDYSEAEIHVLSIGGITRTIGTLQT